MLDGCRCVMIILKLDMILYRNMRCDYMIFFFIYPDTKVTILSDISILADTCAGDVTQKILNCRFIINCRVENNHLIMETEVKINDEVNALLIDD